MTATSSEASRVLVAGGGIGGIAAALALVRRGFAVKVLEQAAELGEIGAGIQLGPNAFAAFDALGIGEIARAKAVYTDEMVMHDALDETLVGRIPTGEAFRQRFGNPYAVIHRADVHGSLLAGAKASVAIEVATSTQVSVSTGRQRVTVFDARGTATGVACRRRRREVGVAPAVLGDDARVSGHVVYRAGGRSAFSRRTAVERRQHLVRPDCTWCTTRSRRRTVQRGRHLPQPRARGVERARRQPGGSADYFGASATRAQLIDLPKDWKRWATADREPIGQWNFGRATLLGDAAHPPCIPGQGASWRWKTR